MSKRKLVEWFKSNHESAEFLDWSLEIQVCMSGAGYYIGMLDKYGAPYCRLSMEYWPSFEEAQEALETGTFRAKTWL